MDELRDRYGDVIEPDEPKWAPLRTLAGPNAVRWFEYLQRIETDDGTELMVYRHNHAGGSWFYLEETGRPWAWLFPTERQYTPFTSAVDAVTAGWGGWWLDCADPDERDDYAAALERAARLDAMAFWAE